MNLSTLLLASLARLFEIRVRTDSLLPSLDELESAPIDLSESTRLKDVVFRTESPSIEWATTALETITPEHRDIRQISFDVPPDLTATDTEANQWLALDLLLVQFWESRSIRPKVTRLPKWEQEVGDHTRCLLPEVTKRRIMDIMDIAESRYG